MYSLLPEELDCQVAPVFGKALENGAGGGGTWGKFFVFDFCGGNLGGGGGAGADIAGEYGCAFECRGGGGG